MSDKPVYIQGTPERQLVYAYADDIAASARLRAAAERVCWFDWSGNDPDAVAAIEELRRATTK